MNHPRFVVSFCCSVSAFCWNLHPAVFFLLGEGAVSEWAIGSLEINQKKIKERKGWFHEDEAAMLLKNELAFTDY